MLTTDYDRDQLTWKIASRYADWEEGRAVSPDTHDFLGDAIEVFQVSLTADRIERVADDLWEAMNGHDRPIPQTAHEIANWLRHRLIKEGS